MLKPVIRATEKIKRKIFDNVFLSGSLLDDRSDTRGYCKGTVRIFAADFLFEKDRQWTGWKPRRTWAGWNYQEGFSDHLPLIVDLYSTAGEPVN